MGINENFSEKHVAAVDAKILRKSQNHTASGAKVMRSGHEVSNFKCAKSWSGYHHLTKSWIWINFEMSILMIWFFTVALSS